MLGADGWVVDAAEASKIAVSDGWGRAAAWSR